MGQQMIKRAMSTMINRKIKVGAIYEHFKSTETKPMHYEVIAIARDCENPESLHVIYKALYETPNFGKNSIWSRQYERFAEKITINGIEKDRFKEIEQPKKS